MLEYIHKMAYKVEPYVSSSFGPGDTMAFMQSVHNQLKKDWYGLCVAQMREDSLFQSDTMFKFVRKWQDSWLHTTLLAKEIEWKDKYESICSGSCMLVHAIGVYCPFPEQMHEAHNPVIWNGKTRL